MDLKTLAATPDDEWPADTGRNLLRILRDEGAGETTRFVAARLAASLTVIDDDLVDQLLSILDRGDFSDKLRSQAALSLGPVLEQSDIGTFGQPKGVPISEGTVRQIKAAFRKHHGDGGVPKTVRRSVLSASVRAPEPWHQDAIRAAYAHRDRDWRITAVFAMRWVDGFEASILDALRSDDDKIRYQAVRAAGNWGLDAAWAYVQPILSQTGDKRVLLAAIDAVASIRPNEAASVLSDFTVDEDDEIVEAAQGALVAAERQLRSDGV